MSGPGHLVSFGEGRRAGVCNPLQNVARRVAPARAPAARGTSPHWLPRRRRCLASEPVVSGVLGDSTQNGHTSSKPLHLNSVEWVPDFQSGPVPQMSPSIETIAATIVAQISALRAAIHASVHVPYARSSHVQTGWQVSL